MDIIFISSYNTLVLSKPSRQSWCDVENVRCDLFIPGYSVQIFNPKNYRGIFTLTDLLTMSLGAGQF